MPVTVIVGGQYGAEGKGKMTAHLARNDNPAAVVRCGGPNSGHTIHVGDNARIVRQLPAGVVNPETKLFIAAGALIDLDVLLEEIDQYGAEERIRIDPGATIISRQDKARETELRLRQRIASTLSGTGAAVSRKVLRDPTLKRANDLPQLSRLLADASSQLNALHDRGARIVIEGTQGFGLSLHHGTSYPFVTSRDTTAAGFLSEVGLSPLTVDQIILVIRTFPIRVGGDLARYRMRLIGQRCRQTVDIQFQSLSIPA